MLRRAASIAFCTATGTSLALPLPMPMRPSPSPTTVSAAKLSVRPPLTTLVTRFTAIIFSFRPSSRPSVLHAGLKLCHVVASLRSELQAGFARGFGQRLDAAVVREAGAVERHLLDAGGLGLLGDALADRSAAAAALPPLPAAPSCSRTSFSAVEALASTFAPSSEMTLA